VSEAIKKPDLHGKVELLSMQKVSQLSRSVGKKPLKKASNQRKLSVNHCRQSRQSPKQDWKVTRVNSFLKTTADGLKKRNSGSCRRSRSTGATGSWLKLT
jgi:hypothetical protein